MTKISIIVPIYNVEKYLKRSLDSLVNQTLEDIEIILVDDGSTDNSFNICQEYVARDNRFKLIHQENKGLAGARNTIIKNVKTEFISWVDSDDWIEEVRASIPEMPDKRRERYTQDWGIPAYDAGVLTQTKEMSDFYDATVAAGADPKLAANWLMGEVNAYLNSKQVELSDTALTPEHLATMIKLIEDETISSKIAKKVFKEIITNDTEPKSWVESKGMVQLSDPAKLQPIIDEVLDNNEQSIEDFKNGKDRAIGFLVGQIMKKTRGMANPKMVNKLLMASLKER